MEPLINETPLIYEVFGYIATTLTVTFSLPQLWKTYKTKNVEAISWLSAIMGLFLIISWLVYGYGINSIQLMITNGICFIWQSILVAFLFKYSLSRKNNKQK